MMESHVLFFCPRCPPCRRANNRGGTVMVAIDHCDHDYSLYCPLCKFRIACEGCPTTPVFDTDESADAALKAGKLYDAITDSDVRCRANEIIVDALTQGFNVAEKPLLMDRWGTR